MRRLCVLSPAALLPAITLFASVVAVAAADDTLTTEHVAKIRTVTSTAISPDGEEVAYTVSVPRIPFQDDNGTSYAELHVVDREGNSRPFITGEVNISDVTWSHDGTALYYRAKRGDDEQTSLYRIPVAGGESSRILTHESSITAYSFNHDDTRVAFLATDKEPKRSKDLAKKGLNAEVYEEDLRFTRVWVAPVDGSTKPTALAIEGNASELHWSPTADQLALALAPTPLVDDGLMARKVHVVDANSGDIVARFENPGKLGAIEWSPNGERIAIISAEEIHDPSQGRLMVATANGGPLVDLLKDFPGHVTSIAWGDDETVMYLADQGCHTSFESIQVDGTGRDVIVKSGAMPMSGLSLAKEARACAVLSESSRHPNEVFVIRHEEPKPKRLTNNNPWLDEMRLAKQEVVRYAARDGLEIEGVLIRPRDEQEGTRYPLILAVHGGPEAHIHNGWLTRYSYPGQVAAAEGIAVFYPNYRGSTGRGVEFSKLGQGDYGGGEFDDLIDAVDYFVKAGLVDTDRVGITGGSYGGFATAWCSTRHTKRFAAGVMFVGISDQISKSGSTDIANEMFLVHARKRPWDDWKFFLERSPIFYVEQARTPLLIMHGKDDPRVHPSQSLELYRQLKILGNTPVRLVYYPGEGHGNRKAGARYDYNLRMMRWFLHYLKGEGGSPPPAELEYPLEGKDEESPETTSE